jgi:hypothetical protein
MAWDMNDAGQDLLRAAALDDSVLSIKIVKQGGDVRYFAAQVKSLRRGLRHGRQYRAGQVHAPAPERHRLQPGVTCNLTGGAFAN